MVKVPSAAVVAEPMSSRPTGSLSYALTRAEGIRTPVTAYCTLPVMVRPQAAEASAARDRGGRREGRLERMYQPRCQTRGGEHPGHAAGACGSCCSKEESPTCQQAGREPPAPSSLHSRKPWAAQYTCGVGGALPGGVGARKEPYSVPEETPPPQERRAPTAATPWARGCPGLRHASRQLENKLRRET